MTMHTASEAASTPTGSEGELAARRMRFHRMLGRKKTRIAFQRRDFADYVLMLMLTALVVAAGFGPLHPVSCVAYVSCVALLHSFRRRHGVEWAMPVLLRRPQDLLYLLIHKLQNLKPMYAVALLLLIGQHFAIGWTPSWPHHVDTMRQAAMVLFYLHLGALTLYRSAILVAHLRKRARVQEILLQTSWKGRVSRSSITLEIWHAYVTGLLTHIALLVPWFLVIRLVDFSLILTPLFFGVSVVVHLRHLQSYNDWFYRDHWLAHNSEVEFLYLHGTHHDAIPSGLIGVSGNGFLEGVLRHSIGVPTPFYSPLAAFLLYTVEVQQDIKNHQYIPGIYPLTSRKMHESFQHSTHHFGRLEPYSIGLRNLKVRDRARPAAGLQLMPDQITDSIRLDEELDGFTWNNATHRKFLELFDRYQRS